MEGSYSEKYAELIKLIEREYDREEDEYGNRSYFNDYHSPAIDKLRETFPNISFSLSDFGVLKRLHDKKEQNGNTIFNLMDSKFGVPFYKSHGHTKTPEEEKQYREALAQKDKIDGEYTGGVEAFLRACEVLSNPNEFSDKVQDTFDVLREYGFKLKPEDPILMGYFNTYSDSKEQQAQIEEMDTEKSSLIGENDQLKKENSKLVETRNKLNQKVYRLQRMLFKTLAVCERIKNHGIGKLFFRNDIKQLPKPEEIQDIK